MKAMLSGACAALLCATAAAAQPPGPPPGCDGIEGIQDFDFWLGVWDVHAADGRFAGTNTITKRSNGCLVLEEWRSATGGDGTSMNYLDPTSGQWRQIWMGSNNYIDYSGGLNEDGQMVLEGEITYFSAEGERSAPFRGIWTPNADGTVTQHFEQFDPDSEVWTVWFTGVYSRSRDADAAPGESPRTVNTVAGG